MKPIEFNDVRPYVNMAALTSAYYRENGGLMAVAETAFTYIVHAYEARALRALETRSDEEIKNISWLLQAIFGDESCCSGK